MITGIIATILILIIAIAISEGAQWIGEKVFDFFREEEEEKEDTDIIQWSEYRNPTNKEK